MIQSSFGREFMNDPDKAFSREYLLTSGNGAYSASTIGNCNTRKYHGLFVAGQPQIDDNDHVLVSAIDEDILYKQKIHQIATHEYPGTLFPAGYALIADFLGNPIPKWVYNIGDCVLVKELMMPENEQAVMIRYSVEETTERIQLNLFPFLAFRCVHKLQRANMRINNKIQGAANGIKVQLYSGYSPVYIQASLKSEFMDAPDWYYNIEYPQEQVRGYDFREDLYVPGHFSFSLKKGDKLVLYIGLQETNSKTLSNRFTNSLKKKHTLQTENDCLVNAAKQFVVKNDDEVKIKAGYYWFGKWGRDTFISLPGLLLSTGNFKDFTSAIKSSLADLKNGLLPNTGSGVNAGYNSADASLWCIWAIQQFALFTNSENKIWAEYGAYLTEILENYRNGTAYDIKMDKDGLISAGNNGVALTWMDAIVDGTPVTPRTGKAVEINALWYNAVCFCIDAARLAGDTTFVIKWQGCPEQISQSFIATFWDKDKQYLADCVHDGVTDWSVRPNQVFALSMPYCPVPEYLRRPVLETVKEQLLTPRGLRTLSPDDEKYKGKYEGNQDTRDLAYHQGSVWPWLLGHYGEAWINEYGADGFMEIEKIHNDCKAMLNGPCLYTIPEIYNGDYPHEAAGAVAQAWSVAELLRLEYLLKKYSESKAIYKTGLV